MRFLSVVGARSELVKHAPVSRALRKSHQEVFVHTGHRYDYGTSPEFFADLQLPEPDHDLGIDAKTHAVMTGELLQRLGPLITEVSPDWVLVYGSSNATLAAALTAAKQSVPVAYIEAGLRSYRRNTPEEINRIVTDHVARLHLCPTQHAVDTLAKEGITEGVHFVGDTMLDSVRTHFARAKEQISVADLSASVGFDVETTPFAFATIHHLENTDDPVRLAQLIDAFSRLPITVVLPLHPRTQESLTDRPQVASRIGANVMIVDPLRPLEVLGVVARAEVVLTDSGGLQREAYFLGSPCVTLRDDTEFVDTLSANTIVGAEVAGIVEAVAAARRLPKHPRLDDPASPFGDGRAADRILEVLERRWPDPI
jgi:UDP-N-acetylglucosamine 2-epimerase